MGQKIRPTGFRVGVMTGWRSQWYTGKNDFSNLLVEDFKIRKFIFKTLRAKQQKGGRPMISRIQIDRTREKVVVSISSGRVGMIIGKKGAEIDKLTDKLKKLIDRNVEIRTIEVGRPETDAQLISEDIAEQLEKRASFRRTMKMAIQKAMENGAKGVKIQLSGRLGGAEMSRCEKAMEGSVPLSTLRTRVEYGFTEGLTAQGHIGIKVWVNNGDYLSEEVSDATNAQTRQVPKKSTRRGPR
jgi:small subunit ribosomal protein S3